MEIRTEIRDPTSQIGKRRRREYEYIRHGTGALLASFAVPTGEVTWNLGRREPVTISSPSSPHRQSLPRNGPLPLGSGQPQHALEPAGMRGHRVVRYPSERKDAAARQGTASVSERPNAQARVPFHAQARQLAQSGRTLVRGSRSPVPCTGRLRSAEDFEARLRQFLDDYNDQYAHPYRWTYTGKPLVRDTPFSQHADRSNTAAPGSALDPKIRAIALLAQTLSTKTASMTGQGLTKRRTSDPEPRSTSGCQTPRASSHRY